MKRAIEALVATRPQIDIIWQSHRRRAHGEDCGLHAVGRRAATAWP